MRRIELALLFVCFLFTAIAQDSGYFGKRTYLDLDFAGSVPLFQNIFAEKGYVERNGKLQESYNLKDFGFRITLGTVSKKNTGFAFEYGYRQYQVNALRLGELNRQYLNPSGNVVTEYIYPKVGFIDVWENIFLPKIVFVTDDSHIPAGFSNEFGIGYTVTSIRNAKPLVEYPIGSGFYSADSISQNLVDPGVKNMSGMTFMYGFRLNLPVSKSLLFHVGFRYSYNALFDKKVFRQQELSEYWTSGREMWSRINQRRQLGVVSFSTGFSYCF